MMVKIKTPTRFEEKLADNRVKAMLLFAFLLFFAMSIAISDEYQITQEIIPAKVSESSVDFNDNLATANIPISIRLNDPDDFDNDGLTNEEEILYRTNPIVADSDGDKLLDGEEVHIYCTNPRTVDSDYDYVCDFLELFKTNTNPISADSDNDGIIDGYELYIHGSNPNRPDTDGDGLTDYEEGYVYHTNILLKDTDKDGLMDGDEILYYLTDPCSSDTDQDGLDDLWEISNNHDPLVPDNWGRLTSLFIAVPTLGVILLFAGIFASVRAQSFQRRTYQTDYDKRIKSEEDKKYLFDLLCSFPPNKHLNIEQLAEQAGCSIESVRELLQNLFENSDEPDSSDFSLDDCVIHTNLEPIISEYTCFYCDMAYDPLEKQCPNCQKEIVRCKLCKIPLACNDQYTTCASCGVFGRENNLTGFLNIDHICESCMISHRYNVV
ncbi:MAG: hypothetical protein ACTSPM_01005 [Candidatus Heimdallarchaeota archaeon]